MAQNTKALQITRNFHKSLGCEKLTQKLNLFIYFNHITEL